MSFAIPIATTLLTLSLLLVMARLFRGPSLADRVVALDVVSYLVICLIAVRTLATGEESYLDAAAILALLGFVATIGFARHLGRTLGGGS